MRELARERKNRVRETRSRVKWTPLLTFHLKNNNKNNTNTETSNANTKLIKEKHGIFIFIFSKLYCFLIEIEIGLEIFVVVVAELISFISLFCWSASNSPILFFNYLI